MGYLNSIKAGALETWKVYKILPSVVGAQGALESGWGTSRLAKPPYNNQFGIKPGNDWAGKTITMPTREYVNGAWITVNEPFRWYDDPGESIRDHGAFFTSTEWRRNNYKAVVGETDYKKACWALQNAPAPYATDPGYAQKLINLIETHNLQAWDREAMAGNSNTVATQTQQTVVSKIVGRELSSAGRTYVKDLNVTMIGDSLGVGTKPHFESLVPKANYDVLGSRQITHATNSLNGTYILQQLKNAGNLKEYVVVILGTNRGVTEQEINNFVNIAGSDRKVIFVDTASEVGHSNTVSVHYENSAKRLSNVYYANWKSTAIPLRPQYYSRDGANGEYIHMTPTGYKKHSEFIAQALYEVATTNFSDKVAETTKTEFYDIKDLELNEDGLITYDVLESNSDGTSTKKKATKQTNIKGLYSPYGDGSIYNPKANQRYGFGSSVNNSNWRESYFEDNEIEDSVRLLELASAELLERQEPEMIYTVNLLEIPVELSIGDTGIFVDHEFSPPLYLQARVLSLTTSETNPSLNKVTIGNVTELAPQDKSALMALRAELQETRKDLESNWIGSISTNMTVVSTNGYVLGDRTRETSLVARVLKGKGDITNQYDKFTWERISEDGSKDSVYNDSLANSVQSSVLTVYEADIIGNQSKFVARAFNAKNELVSHQEIVLKRVETAIWVDTDTPPAYATDGSTWVNQDGEQYVKVDGEWEKRVDQTQIFTVKEDIDAAKLIADNAKSDADDARQRAEDALTEAGISTDLAQTAKDLAQLAEDNAETAKANAQTAINEAGVAVSQAVQAINTADTAKTNAQTALTNAQTALTEAGNAKTTANNLLIKVDEVEAEVELKASQTTVDGLSGTVSEHSTTLSQHANQIASKADSSFVNTIKGTVDTHTTEIAQNASDIKSKASASSVNTLTGRVSTAETTISQHANAISSKASQTEVDSLSGTVSSHTSTLGQHAKDISARLTSAQVNTLVDGKGLAKVAYVDNQISATAESFGIEMTKVEGKIPTEIGGTNLVPDSDLIGHSRGIIVWLHASFKPSEEGLEVKSTASSGTYGIRTRSFDVIGGQDYIISADIGSYYSVHLLNYIYIMYEDGLANQRLDELPIDSSTITLRRYGLKFKASRTGRVNILFGKVIGYSGEGFRIRNIKLEKGSIQSDWSPAPVDSLSNNDFTTFKNSYSITIAGITTELNKTAKKTDLNGMVTESYLATNQYTKQGEINTQLQSYLKTTDLEGKVQETTAFQNVKATTDRFTRVIGSTDAQAKTNIAQIAMTDSLFQATVRDSIDIGGSNAVRNTDMSISANINEALPWSTGTSIARALPPDYPRHFIYAGTGNQDVGYAVGFEFGKSTGFSIEKDQVYTLSFLSLSSNAINVPYDYLHIMRNVGNNQRLFIGSQDFEIVEVGMAYTNVKLYKHTYTFKANWSEPKAWLLIASRTNRVDLYQLIQVAQIQLEKGNIATDWTPAPEDKANQSEVTQLANNWAVRMLNSKNDIVSQINLSDSTFLIEAKNIVGLGNAVINGKLTVTEDMIAGTISADKIRGGTISGTTFRTDDTANNFRMTLHGGRIDFMHGNTTLGSLYSTLDSQTNVVNGVANVQTPGYIYSINSRSSSSSQSRPVIQIPENSSMDSRKLNIWANGGFRVESDTLTINSEYIRTLKPFVAGDGFQASHQQSSAGASIANAGHLIYSVDADSNGVLIHRLQPRPKGGSIRNSGIAIYEDGRVAVVKNGVWTQL